MEEDVTNTILLKSRLTVHAVNTVNNVTLYVTNTIFDTTL